MFAVREVKETGSETEEKLNTDRLPDINFICQGTEYIGTCLYVSSVIIFAVPRHKVMS